MLPTSRAWRTTALSCGDIGRGSIDFILSNVEVSDLRGFSRRSGGLQG